MSGGGVPPLRHEITVDAPPADAFAAFGEGINSWWPRDYTWSGRLLERVAIDPWIGGFCHEIGSGGMRLDWGRVSAWEPPRRVAFSWQVGPDRVPEVSPARASQVDVRFDPAGAAGTRVTLVHGGW
ncbi:MAG TPA: SRPBCC domain-containing protein, partial [Candidatus Limnocylindria bacterium]|nr:SRPBCC domain-containing protein [Candidatus Limnocylindria bacterium]